MPKLTRYLQKIFANNSNQVGVFGTGVDKETSKNVETLQSADYEEGWSSAIITNKNYPIWQEMDGVQYGLSYQLKYLFQNGIPEWLSTETYYTNSYCRVGSNIYYSLQDDNTNHNPALNDGWWTPLLTSNRSIGEIIPSTIPLTEAGLHLLDGALITNGMYADFITYMANLTATAPDCFCTEAEWQQSVATYGVCGKFVYDSVNNTVRLPKYGNQIFTTNNITTASTVPVVGNGIALGFTNGTTESALGNVTSGHIYPWLNGVGQAVGTAATGNYLTQDAKYMGISTNPEHSGMVANISSLTNQYGLNTYYYIVVATSTKTDIQVDIDEIATDLNGKADTDLSNINASSSAKAAINTWGMPDYDNYVDQTSSWGTELTAPSNGLIIAQDNIGVGSTIVSLTINNVKFFNGATGFTSTGIPGFYVQTLVKTGDTYKAVNGNGANRKLYFVPLIGG